MSSVIDMDTMFYGAASFNQSLSSWDVSSVIDMDNMFDPIKSFDKNNAPWYFNTPNSI